MSNDFIQLGLKCAVTSKYALVFWEDCSTGDKTIEGDSGRERLRRYANSLMDVWSVFLPIHISNEEIGDYLEDIRTRIDSGQRFKVVIRLIAAIFWTGINAVGYAMKALGKKQAS